MDLSMSSSDQGSPSPTCGGEPGTAPEVEVPKEMVDFLLRSGKAVVLCESEKRTRSDVWKYFGRVRLTAGQGQEAICKDVVACVGCNMVYLYRSKSQGTSTLRHHKCPYVFQVLGKDTAAVGGGGSSGRTRTSSRGKQPAAQSKFESRYSTFT